VVATSNLLVRKSILDQIPFDIGFTGWGWEDVDWALRAEQAGFGIYHVDISATHLGLDEAGILLDKYAKAGPNFHRMIKRHPGMEQLPGTRLALFLGHMPARPLLKRALKAMVLAQSLPLKLRVLALQIWRALWAGDGET
jgi:hypothetical protein